MRSRSCAVIDFFMSTDTKIINENKKNAKINIQFFIAFIYEYGIWYVDR